MPRMHPAPCESPHGRMFWSAILLLALTAPAVRANSTATVLPVPSEKLVCSFLKQPLCRMAGYNQTAFPNQRQHETQEEATGEMADFSKLWTEGSSCSNAIVYFLCSRSASMSTAVRKRGRLSRRAATSAKLRAPAARMSSRRTRT